MRAVMCGRYGPPEGLEIREVERPTPREGEVLVAVHATTVNRTDVATLHGTPFFARLATGVRRPRHPILGTEFAGRIEAVGAEVTGLAVGDDVFGFSGATFGAHAEYLVVPADGPVATIPAGLSYAEVASSTEGTHYALSSLEAADLGAGDEVLVYGATGAIGTAAVQLLVHRGAPVTAVCDPHGTDVVASLGADVVIDRSRQDFTRTSARFDAILDAVGQTTLPGGAGTCCKPGAPYLSTDLGPGWQNLALIPWTRWSGTTGSSSPSRPTCAGTCWRSANCSPRRLPAGGGPHLCVRRHRRGLPVRAVATQARHRGGHRAVIDAGGARP
jgi:NADPH:quinone reductase-like Zn-dependent oxidoreductase